MNRIRPITFTALCLLGVTLPVSPPVQAAPLPVRWVTPAEERADFIVNLPLVVKWPVVRKAAKTRLCTLGHGDVTKAIERALMSGLAGQITLNPDSSLYDLPNCDILYVSPSRKAFFTQHVAEIGALPILTIGEDAVFVAAHGMIAFTGPPREPNVETDRKLSFRINNEEAQRMGIGFDAMLLELADKVEGSAR